eukprot:scaffold36879_cov99-Phaeocystis_antarctica.AAC.5
MLDVLPLEHEHDAPAEVPARAPSFGPTPNRRSTPDLAADARVSPRAHDPATPARSRPAVWAAGTRGTGRIRRDQPGGVITSGQMRRT